MSAYSPYISPAREIARKEARDAIDDAHPEICSDSIRDMTGFHGDDARWCIELKRMRTEEHTGES